MKPSSDGLSLQTYSGADANDIDINGELSKVAFNVCFGHGVHSGIHFRSSNYWGVLLGEAVARSVLKDRAKSYKEPFPINITKFDGTTTITNQNQDSSLLLTGLALLFSRVEFCQLYSRAACSGRLPFFVSEDDVR